MPSFLPDLIALLQRVHELSLTDAELSARLDALTVHLPAAPPPVAPAPPVETKPVAPPPPAEPAPDPVAISKLAEHFRAGGAVALTPETPTVQLSRVPTEATGWIKRLDGKDRLATWLVRRAELHDSDPARVASGDVDRRREAVALGGDIARLLDDAPTEPSEDEIEAYRLYAGNCKATARAVDLLVRQLDTTDDEAGLLQLLAESLSALRYAARTALNGREDADQDTIFSWLKRRTSEARVFVRRHMRLDDPAEPEAWPDRIRRIEAFAGEPETSGEDETHQRLFKRLRYHLKLITRTPTVDHEHDWTKVLDTITELVQTGLPPSHAGLRDELLPVLEILPEREFSTEIGWVLREIDRFLESRLDDDLDEDDEADWPERTGVVAEAAALMHGRAAVLIGGTRRPHAAEALEAALGLSELVWVTTREHQSHTAFEGAIARPDVAVVLLAIRWSSHGFGEVKAYCDLYDKPLVRLKAGYNPNQVAVHLIEQASGRLRDA